MIAMYYCFLYYNSLSSAMIAKYYCFIYQTNSFSNTIIWWKPKKKKENIVPSP